MQGDISRQSFAPAEHYSSVRLQQGRVITDADWNEQADLTRYRAERQSLDIIGECGAPMAAAGFELTAGSYPRAVFADGGSPGGIWIVGEDGVVLKSQDGGATWTLFDAGVTAHLHGVRFAGGTGWIVGDSGTIRKTIDGGATWVGQDGGVTTTLHGLSMLDGNRAWAVGAAGVVLRTTDGGMSWLPASAGGMRLNAVHFLDANDGLAVGQGGTILRSNDGGATWTAVVSGALAHLKAIAFANAMTGWAVGDQAILKTLDGGATWTAQNAPATASLCAAAVRDAMEGWAVGDHGLALHTTDGGTTWARVDVGTARALRGVSLPAGQSGWAVGDASVVVRLDAGSPSFALQTLPDASLSIASGRLYAHGVLCELEARASYYNQPDRGRPPRLTAGTHLIYLQAAQRHLSHLEAPDIREVALNGPDTATRAKTICQVKALRLPTISPANWNCLSPHADWDALVAPSPARLKARAEPRPAAVGVCDIAATAGYRRLENQLYRIEVHEAGAAPTFKWSRDNGSVAFAVESILPNPATNETVVRLGSRGRDETLDLEVDDRVELIDDHATLEHRAGLVFRYARDGDDPNEIVLAGLVGDAVGRDPTRHPLLRRWQHRPAAPGQGVLAIAEGEWVDLEDGVQVWFEPGGSYRSGDYWTIPARTITGDVEWPRDADGEPLARPPAGIEDVFCRLGLIEVAGDGRVSVVSDCRTIFPPITELDQLLYVSGDGQDGPPGLELAQPLVVRAARGRHGVKDARVRFGIETGNGTLTGAPPGGSLDIDTDSQGMAVCRWVLDADPRAVSRHQRVRASLLDAAGQAVEGQAVVFCATATAALHYVSGDGQTGQPGQPLAHKLEVRVANGQRAVANASVRFSIVVGGGTLAGANPVATGPDGMARIDWQLGTSGLQRAMAEMVDGAGTAVQHIAFNAGFEPQASGGGGGCEVTIGVGGQVEKLDTATLERFFQERGPRLCLCFLPGEHVIDDLDLGGSGIVRISLHGCGQASLIRLQKPVQLTSFAAVEVADLAIVAEANCGFGFKDCGEVLIRGLDVEAPVLDNRPFLFFEIVIAIAITGCAIRTQMPGFAVVFEDAQAITQVHENDIGGIVSFYGQSPLPIQLIDWRRLAERFNDIKLEPAAGRLFMSNNQLRQLAIGRNKMQEIDDIIVGNAGRLTGLYAAASLYGNTLLDAQNQFISRVLTVASSSFLAEPTRPFPLAICVTDIAAVCGNLTLRPETNPTISITNPLNFVTKKNRFREAGNVAWIINP